MPLVQRFGVASLGGSHRRPPVTPRPESTIQAEAMLAVGAHPDVRLFRNSVGQGWTGHHAGTMPGGLMVLRDARRVTFGLCPGSCDAIGWRSVVVTPDMVGQRLAVFAAPEFKTTDGRVRPDQVKFITAVQRAGGLAGLVRSDADMRKLLSVP